MLILSNIIYIVKYYCLYSNHNSKGTMVKSKQTTEEEVIEKLSMKLRVPILPGLEAR